MSKVFCGLLGLRVALASGTVALSFGSSPSLGDPAPMQSSASVRMAVSDTADTLGSLPLRVESSLVKDTVEGDISGRLDFSFAEARAVLGDPAAWCAILTLHLNVKACLYRARSDSAVLRVYGGRKEFQKVANAKVLEYEFTARNAANGALTIDLMATQGPFGTTEHRIQFVAKRAPATGTAIRLRYHYRISPLAKWSLRLYLATAGRKKIGFTVLGENRRGTPIYVHGARGMVERNAVRYYLAVVAYLESRAAPEALSTEWLANRWFDLTEHYADQLHEIDRSDYLANKRREFAQQGVRQAQMGSARH